MKSAMLIFAVLACLAANAIATDVGTGTVLQLGGRVIRMNAIGGETTGYALKFGGTITINGAKYSQIEIDPNGVAMRPYVFRLVQVTGPVVIRSGVERQNYPVLIIENIARTK